MDFRIVTILALWLTLSVTEGSPQRTLNTLSNKDKPSAVVSQDESSKQAKIMKQINKVNEDGSYTFGYEADDGSFRVETRSKDGVVKGKYGYVDSNGELKVMEYTAGERTGETIPEEPEDEEDGPEQGSTLQRRLIPQVKRGGAPVTPTRGTTTTTTIASPPSSPPTFQVPLQDLRHLQSRQSKAIPSITLPPPTPTQFQARNDQAFAAQTPTGRKAQEDEENSSEEKSEQEDDSGKDVNNGQYFRAIPQQGGSPPTLPNPTTSAGPRYVPSQYPQGFSTLPREYTQQGPQHQYQRFPQEFSGPPPPTPYSQQQQYSPQSYAPQHGQSRPLSGQSIHSPYSGQYEEESFPQGGQPSQFPPQYAQQNPNVQVQVRGSPQEDPRGQISHQQQQPYYPQQFQQQSPQQQFGGFSPSRQQQFEGERSQDERYVPNLNLDGFSEDADEDGYVDEPPNSIQGGIAAAQEKQGVAVKAVGGGRGQSPGEAYRPQVLGPQGVLQGGQVLGQQQPGLGGGVGRAQYLGQQGQQRQPPQLSEEQIQQILAQQYQGQGQGGPGPQQFLGQQGGRPQQFGGFPGQGSYQGFAPQQQQQQPSPFLRPGQGGSQQQFTSPQQNPLLQGQYPSQQSQQGQTDEQEQFAGFPPQFIPQGQQGGQQQYLGQGSPFGGQGQYMQGPPPQNGFPQGYQPSPQGQSQPAGQGSPIQSGGFPFDFNQFGSLPGGPSQGFQGGQGQFQGFPGQAAYPQQGQGLTQQQIAALQNSQAGGPQGFPGGPQQIQGYVPGRFPQQQFPPQYFGPGGGSSSQGASPQQSPVGVQLGGGQARPVQAGSPNSGGLFDGDARKQISSGSSTSSAKTLGEKSK